MAEQKERVGLPPIIPKKPPQRRRRRHGSGQVVSGGFDFGRVNSGGFDFERVNSWGFKDLEKAEELVDEAARELCRLNHPRKRELLDIRFLQNGEQKDDKKTEKGDREKMLGQFGNGNGPLEYEADPIGVCVAVLNKYASALIKAIKEVNQEINQKTQIIPGLLEQRKTRKENQKRWQEEQMQKQLALLLDKNAA